MIIALALGISFRNENAVVTGNRHKNPYFFEDPTIQNIRKRIRESLRALPFFPHYWLLPELSYV